MNSQRTTLVLFAMIVLAIASCKNASTNQNSSQNPKVRLALNWFPDAQHGGFYAAVAHGYFEEEGLDVEIVPGGPGVPVIEKVALGRNEFGVSNADQLILMRAQGAEVVALLAPFQNSPRCIMVHKESNIDSFDKLQGITLALGPGRPFAEFLKRNHELKDVRVVNYSGTITRFLADKSYAQQAYSISEPFVAQREGATPVCLMLSDIGFSPYTSCLFTSDQYETENPEVVERIVRACRRGWIQYLEDPTEANELIHQANPEMDLESLEFASRELKALCQPEGLELTEVGTMSSERWDALMKQLVDIEFIENGFKTEDVYRLEYLKTKSDAVETEAQSSSD